MRAKVAPGDQVMHSPSSRMLPSVIGGPPGLLVFR